ncbi:hypothetical protein CNYM01_13666 [Colletotrichum nymphaeae SA-01]|uniref:Uncharacterized protein n=1 Tax=Colletotrichum nymphaeae SA-01 TaxID=1460502 RepID=A0A135UGZ4_9PEZI|nr:hypothetical protein CNYM01_13666 [Colletotrichum nymphaeae SA-01]
MAPLSQFIHKMSPTSFGHRQAVASGGVSRKATRKPNNLLPARKKTRRGKDTTDQTAGRSVGVMAHVSTFADGDSICGAPRCFDEQLPSVGRTSFH